MGFDLAFMRLRENGEVLDPDFASLEKFLTSEGLFVKESGFVGCIDENDPQRVGSLQIKPGEPGGTSGFLDHASLSNEELNRIFGLCAAAGWLIINPQAYDPSPLMSVPARNHDERTMNGLKVRWAFVDSVEELEAALIGDFERFQEFKRSVVAGPEDDHPPSTM